MAASAPICVPGRGGKSLGWPGGPFPAPVFPRVRSSPGRHAQRLQLTSYRELVMHGLVNVCMTPTEVVLSAFPINSGKIVVHLGEVFEREGSWQF